MNAVSALLDWDQETHMPKEAITLRSEQTEIMASLVHQEKTSKRFAKALFTLIDRETGSIADSNLSEGQMASLTRWRTDYLRSVKLPMGFVTRFSKTISIASHAWKTAKEHNDFGVFAPHLEKIVHLSRKKAELLGFKEHPYDALLDLYEPNLTVSTLTPLFNHLKEALTALLKKIQKHPQKHPSPVGPFSHDLQKRWENFY